MRRVAITSALILSFSGTGCQLRRSNFYPLGIYSIPTTNDLRIVRQAGFDLVTGPAERKFLDSAHSLGLKVLAFAFTSAGKNFDALAARRAVSGFDSHPALWAWYLVDEPDMNNVSPEEVVNAHRFFKQAGAKKPTALVIYQGGTALDYANIADITMIDRYPIPWIPLANLPQHVRMARLALGKKKPLIAVIQAFDWNAYPQELKGEKNLRAPTYEELRCMTYCALAQRATGLFYFCYESKPWKITEHPDVWSALKNVVREVNERLPLFQAEHLWWPMTHEFADRTIRFNAALDSSVTSVLLRVRQGNSVIPRGDYILAINNTEKKQVYSFTLPRISDRHQSKERSNTQLTGDWRGGSKQSMARPPSTQSNGSSRGAKEALASIKSNAVAAQSDPKFGVVPVLGEDRFLAALNSWVTDEFSPYAIHVYGPLGFESEKK